MVHPKHWLVRRECGTGCIEEAFCRRIFRTVTPEITRVISKHLSNSNGRNLPSQNLVHSTMRALKALKQLLKCLVIASRVGNHAVDDCRSEAGIRILIWLGEKLGESLSEGNVWLEGEVPSETVWSGIGELEVGGECSSAYYEVVGCYANGLAETGRGVVVPDRRCLDVGGV